jgi:hypothetical protein
MDVKEENYERYCTDKFRTKKCLSLFGFIMAEGYETDFHWTGKWFQYVTIKQQKCSERYSKYDDGWTYKDYWSEWHNRWYLVEILKK